METQTSISKRLRDLRTQKGLTQKEVADKLGIPSSTYRSWEYGASISGEPYQQLCVVFEVGLADLLGGRTTQNTQQEILEEILHIEERLQELKRKILTLI